MKYEIKRYYSSFVTYEVEAESEEEAFNKTKGMEINLTELQNNLSPAVKNHFVTEDNITYALFLQKRYPRV